MVVFPGSSQQTRAWLSQMMNVMNCTCVIVMILLGNPWSLRIMVHYNDLFRPPRLTQACAAVSTWKVASRMGSTSELLGLRFSYLIQIQIQRWEKCSFTCIIQFLSPDRFWLTFKTPQHPPQSIRWIASLLFALRNPLQEPLLMTPRPGFDKVFW